MKVLKLGQHGNWATNACLAGVLLLLYGNFVALAFDPVQVMVCWWLT
jgi:hypothetical protein